MIEYAPLVSVRLHFALGMRVFAGVERHSNLKGRSMKDMALRQYRLKQGRRRFSSLCRLPTLLMLVVAACSAGADSGALQQARELRHAGHADQAIEILQAQLRQTPQDVDVSLELVWALIQDGRLAQAQQTLASIRAQYPALVDARLAQALLWRKQGDERAEVEYRAILAQHPENAGARNGLAGIYSQQGKTQEASALYQANLARNSDDYDALMGMGRLKAQEREWQQAEEYYDRAQDSLPGSDEPRVALEAIRPDEPWRLTSWYTWSSLDHGYGDWHEFTVNLDYQATADTWIGGGATYRDRSGQDDILYSLRFSHFVNKSLEIHGEATFTPGADFSPDQSYSAGLDWRAAQPFSLLFDYKRLNYSFGDIDVYTPGAVLWFDDRDYLTGRYSYGRAFGDTDFHYYSLLLTLGLPADGDLRIGAAHGADPERAPGVPSTIITKANTFYLYAGWPVTRDTKIFGGIEHELRKGVYTRDSLNIGFSTRF